LITFLLLLLVLIAYWAYEYHTHQVHLSYIPTRVHVNGTRGKSSVTRLIYGALHEAGARVAGKTTGTNPRYLDVEGNEHQIPRVGKPNIREQVTMTRRAFEEKADALVFECMALQPEIQSLSEDKILHATVGVMTNIRADHLDVMGPTVADVGRTLARTVPRHGVLFTAETEPALLALLEEAARRRGTQVVRTQGGAITEADMAGFRYLEHPENVALALAVAQHLGVRRDIALQGMWSVNPDPGVLRVHDANFDGHRVRLVNAFAANDPQSIRLIFDRLQLDESARRVIPLVYCRPDRIQRSEQMADLLAGGIRYDVALLVGRRTRVAAARAVRRGADPERILTLEGQPIDRVMEKILEVADQGAVVVGIGNIVGLGEQIVERFRHREEIHVLHRGDRARPGHQPPLL